MKVLLRDDVAGVGRRGDIVKVAGGFARNFLLPEGRAIVASEGIRRCRPSRCAGAATCVRRRTGSAAEARRPSWRAPWSRSGPGRRGWPALRLDRAGRRGRRDQGGQGRRGGPSPRGAAGAIKETGTFDVTVDLFPDVATVVTVEVTAAD